MISGFIMKSRIYKILVRICLVVLMLSCTEALMAVHLKCYESCDHDSGSKEKDHSEHNSDKCSFCQHYLHISKVYTSFCQCSIISDAGLDHDIFVGIFSCSFKLYREPFIPRGPPVLIPA